MLEIMARLLGMYGTFKNFHYRPCGIAFAGTHPLGDRLTEGWLDFIDALQEKAMLADTGHALEWADIQALSEKYTIRVENLTGDAIIDALDDFQRLITGSHPSTRAVNVIFDDISNRIADNMMLFRGMGGQ